MSLQLKESAMKVLSYPDLKSKGISYSRVHIMNMVDAGKFPAPIKLGENRIAWVEGVFDGWIVERMRERGSVRVRCPGPRRKRLRLTRLWRRCGDVMGWSFVMQQCEISLGCSRFSSLSIP